MMNFITGSKARELIEESNALLVDVRNPNEFISGSAPGALNIPVHMIPHMAHQLETDKPIIVYCLSGGRSAQAQMILNSMGFNDVHNVGSLQNFMGS